MSDYKFLCCSRGNGKTRQLIKEVSKLLEEGHQIIFVPNQISFVEKLLSYEPENKNHLDDIFLYNYESVRRFYDRSR